MSKRIHVDMPAPYDGPTEMTPRPVQPVGEATTRQAVRNELRCALEVLQADFEGRGGHSGFRAEAMAHIRKALLWLEAAAS